MDHVHAVMRDERGMTIVEVMISAVIFFIVLTAILGLVGVTTNIGIQAKQKTVTTNVVNSYVERVLAMDFEDVVTDGSEGSLSVETTSIGEFTVTVTPSVRPYTIGTETVDSLKYLDLTVAVSSSRDETYTVTTTVTVRDRSELMSQAVSDPETDPTIAWGSLTPPENSVVSGHTWANGEIFIDVDAAAQAGRTVEAVSVYVNDRLVKNTAEPPAEASWLPSAETFSSGATFIWDTEQTYLELQEDGITEIPRKAVPDGVCTLTAWVVDSENVRISITRHFLVDNEAPPVPETPTASVDSDVQTTLSWPLVYDGVTPTDHYGLEFWRVCTPAEYATAGYWYWHYLGESDSGTNSMAYATTPFTRYAAHVQSVSPLHESGFSGWCFWVSRPRVTGTYSSVKSANKYTTSVNLACTPPNFPLSGSATYRWERIDSGGNVTVLPATGQTATDSVTGAKNAGAPVLYYRCTVTYTRYGQTVADSPILSNTVGPTSTGTNVSFGEGTW